MALRAVVLDLKTASKRWMSEPMVEDRHGSRQRLQNCIKTTDVRTHGGGQARQPPKKQRRILQIKLLIQGRMENGF